MSDGPLEVTLQVDPSSVTLDRDVLVTVSVEAPSEIDVTLPILDDRLQGFQLKGSFDDDPARREGRILWRRHARLTPVIADEYRLAPMAILFTDTGQSPAVSGWIATRPLVLEAGSPFGDGQEDDITTGFSPLWIHPAFSTVLVAVGIGLLVIALLVLAGWLLRRVHHTVQLRRMSPRERALKELAVLLAKDLPGKQRVKDFYVELTMIVRRYIERQHAIRAPEQTTEEFLAAAARDNRFPESAVVRLTAFLRAADLVKFADDHPSAETVHGATQTARDYIQTDTTTSEEKG